MATPRILGHLKNNVDQFDSAEDKTLIMDSFNRHSIGYSGCAAFLMYGTFTVYRESKLYLKAYKNVLRSNLYFNIGCSVVLCAAGMKA